MTAARHRGVPLDETSMYSWRRAEVQSGFAAPKMFSVLRQHDASI
jgi:hypothetical protein